MPKEIEHRSYKHEQRAATVDGNTLVGYIAVYNTLSEDFGGYREMLAPGCFEPLPADIPALINHNTDLCIARTSAKTLELTEDNTGLAYTIDLPDTTAGRDLKVSVLRGDLTGCSFGFICNDDTWITEDDGSILRVIRSVEVCEVSVGVTFPAYSATSSQVRSLPDSMPAEYRSLIEARSKSTPQTSTNEQVAAEWRANAELNFRLAEAG